MAEEPLEDVNQDTNLTDPSSAATSEELVDTRDYKEELANVQLALQKEREKNKKRASIAALQSPVPQVEIDEFGNIDPIRYKENIKAELRQEQQMVNALQQDWASAVSQFPQIAASDKLARAVKGTYNQNLLEGEYQTYAEIAADILGEVEETAKKARREGIEEAQVSEKIQARAGIEAPSAPSGKGKDTLIERYQSGQLSKDEIRANWTKIVSGLAK